MSMECFVFIQGDVPGKAAVQRALKALDFPFRLKPATGRFEADSGFMPMSFRRLETGVECYVDAAEEVRDDLAHLEKPYEMRFRVGFRWGGDAVEGAAAYALAAAFAHVTGDVVYDGESGDLLTPEKALALAKSVIASIPKAASDRPANSPHEIKKRLAPLLKMRPDLALFGRLLVMRPVRHILRGVYFDRSSNPNTIYVERVLMPLAFKMSNTIGDSRIFHIDCEPSYADALTFDKLLNEALLPIAKFDSLDAIAEHTGSQAWNACAHYIALRLSGREREAKQHFEAAMTDATGTLAEDLIGARAEFAEKGLAATCAAYREREAARIELNKLGKIYEPSRFRAELEPNDDAASVIEPAFPAAPWIVNAPGWSSPLPETPGDVRYAFYCDRSWTRPWQLVKPLTRAEARERYRSFRGWVRAEHHGDRGVSLLFMHDPPSILDLPRRPEWWMTQFYILFADTTVVASVRHFGSQRPQIDSVSAWSASPNGHAPHTIENFGLGIHEGQVMRRDDRVNPPIIAQRPITADDETLLFIADDFDRMAEQLHVQMRALLAREGYDLPG